MTETRPILSRVRFVLLGLFFMDLVVVGVRLFIPDGLFGPGQWPETLLVILAAATMVGTLMLELPPQNVVFAFLLAVLMAAGVLMIDARTGIPFGASEVHVSKQLSWVMLVAWVSILLICRGVARLALAHWRAAANYGFYVLGLTVLLAALLMLNLGPFAAVVKHYWIWKPGLVAVGAWAVAGAIILAVITPWLINKSPVPPKADYTPFWMWLSVHSLLLTGAAWHWLWAGSLLSCLQMLVMIAFVAWSRRAQPGTNANVGGRSEIRSPKSETNSKLD